MPRSTARAQPVTAQDAFTPRRQACRKVGKVLALHRGQGAPQGETDEPKDCVASLLATNPYRTDPATYLATFSLTATQRTQLASQNDFCRAHEIGLLLYAHLYHETCRDRHVAILSHAADLALQRYWQANREMLVEDVLAVFFSEPRLADKTLGDLAARAIATADELRLADDATWDAANEAAYVARNTFRQRFFATTGLDPQLFGQLQMEGVL